MFFPNRRQKPRGVIILIGVIVMTVVLLLVATSISFLSYTSLRSADTYDDSFITSYHADACLDEALLRLRRDSSYAGGILQLGQVTCRVNVTDTGGTGRAILAEGEYNGIRQGVQATAIVTANVSLLSWSRCPSSGNSKMEAGQISGVTDAWQRVAFRQCYLNPIVKGLPYELNSLDANDARIRNVTSSGFDLRLQNPSDAAVTGELVNYLVVETGSFTLPDSTKVEAHLFSTSTVGSAPSAWSSDAVAYAHTHASAPVVFAQVMTSYDDSFVTTWVNGGAQATPPTNAVLNIGLNLAQAGTTHAVEEIGWIAISSAVNSTVAGISYETQNSAAVITGHDNGCASVNYAGTYGVNPILIGQQLAMSDGDGGWLVQCAQSTTAARLHIEEDQIADSERSHAAERAAIAAFEQTFVYSQ